MTIIIDYCIIKMVSSNDNNDKSSFLSEKTDLLAQLIWYEILKLRITVTFVFRVESHVPAAFQLNSGHTHTTK